MLKFARMIVQSNPTSTILLNVKIEPSTIDFSANTPLSSYLSHFVLDS